MKPAAAGAFAGAVLLVPATAAAHVAVQTVALLSGAVQPWAIGDSAALLGASALWLAQGASATAIRLYVVTGAALALGAGAGLAAPSALPAPWLYLPALAIALAVCTRRRPPDATWLLVLGATSVLAGYRAGADAVGGVAAPLAFTGGVFLGGLAMPLAVGVLLGQQSNPIVAIATRIIASWLAALSAMMLAFNLHR
ncbi:MAG: hypothetical protein JSR54_04415 [Proteobacteria bacterium]|nr:hypothetical protein [Pseudomonadota bacterium]